MPKFNYLSLLIISLAGALCLPAQSLPFTMFSSNLKSLKAAAMEEQLAGDDEGALDLYERIIEIASKQYGPSSSYVGDLYLEMGTIALKTAKFQKAEQCLTQAVRLNPNSVTARVRLSELLRLRGQSQEARLQAQTAVSHHHNSKEARLALALCYLDLGNVPKATQAFYRLQQVVKGKPTPVDTIQAVPNVKLQPILPTKEDVLEKSKITKKAEDKSKNVKAKSEQQEKIKALTKNKERELAKQTSKHKTRAARAWQGSPSEEEPAVQVDESQSGWPTVETKAKPVPQTKSKPVPQTKSKPARGGLVPPPPPLLPIFPGFAPPPVNMVPAVQLNTEAKVKKEKPKEQPKEPAQTTNEGAEDTDFLLDWAAAKGRKKE